MFDDIQDLNEYQIKTLNSWIAFRDNSLFSFKLASSKVDRPSTITGIGGTIIEGHDYIEIDMEGAYQNSDSNFAKMAKEIVEKRVKSVGIDTSVEKYFPQNPTFIKDLEQYKTEAREDAEKKVRQTDYYE
ncbi:MAG: hypothetical protein LBQ50_05085 [Planctomycetaceae bacterium]|jgi:hypothetical protein|nr:hypothetical protein [Planctomycetaceae bacterium]